jgi:serine palmitoyltransferase
MVLPNVHNLGYKAGQGVYRLYSNHTLPQIPPLAQIWDLVRSLPMLYMDWWWNLVAKDPVHVFVETTLLVSVVLMIVLQRSKDWREDNKEHLTEPEKEQLLRLWKEQERHDLAPPLTGSGRTNNIPNVVVHANHGRTMDIREGDDGELKTVLNFATCDFLGMASCSPLTTKDKHNDGPGVAVKNAAREALQHYGCGSCGPRGFYGTIDVHLALEEKISKFTQTEGAIMYSDGASTVSSTVAAFAKRGDLLVVDDGVYEPLLTGISLSRANVEWFQHNDMVRCPGGICVC